MLLIATWNILLIHYLPTQWQTTVFCFHLYSFCTKFMCMFLFFWQIKRLKEQHFAELNELYNKLSAKLQQIDSIIPRKTPSEQHERMKSFKILLGRIIQMLLISKSAIQPSLRDKIPLYERQILNIRNAQRSHKPPTWQAPNSNISQQQQPFQTLQAW
jgi:PAX-interacting protein 1